jgi:hypothetical protein
MYSLNMSGWVREVQQMGRGKVGGTHRLSSLAILSAAGIKGGIPLGSMTPVVLVLLFIILD